MAEAEDAERELELAIERELEVFDRLEQHARDVVAERGTFERTNWGEGIPVVDVRPLNPRARPIQIVGEQFLHVNVGDHGGQFELSYSADDEALAVRIIDAVVAGRVSESIGLTGTTAYIEVEEGAIVSETAFAVWRRLDGARRHTYEPY